MVVNFNNYSTRDQFINTDEINNSKNSESLGKDINGK